jgi:DNA-binding CsgD family transcriptional regulator
LVIGDGALRQALRRQLASRPEFVESEEHAASVVIADAPLPEHDFGGTQQVLLVGSSGKAWPNETRIESLDPELILATATVLAAGYRIMPEHALAGPIHLSIRESRSSACWSRASNKLIARELDISVHTAQFHVTAVLDKLAPATVPMRWRSPCVRDCGAVGAPMRSVPPSGGSGRRTSGGDARRN